MEAFIFDMDGVIINTEEIFDIHFESYGKTLGIDLSKKIIDEYRGKSDEQIWIELIEKYQLKGDFKHHNQIIQDLVNYDLQNDPNIVLEPGIKNLLDSLTENNVKIALASSADRYRIDLIISQYGIEKYFSAIVSADDVEYAKPDPQIYLKAASQINTDPSKCWVLEDSTFGIQAAKSAGMKCIGYKGAYDTFQDHELADIQVSSINDIDLLQLGLISTYL